MAAVGDTTEAYLFIYFFICLFLFIIYLFTSLFLSFCIPHLPGEGC